MSSPLARSALLASLDDPDSALVTRAQAGGREAFEELVHRHADHLYRVVRRLGLPREAAEDITQETFLRAWRGINAFKGEARFLTWLYRIGLNEARRRLEREPTRALRSMDEEHAVEVPDPRYEPHARLAHAELRAALGAAVHSISVKYRAPLILRDIEGLSTADAAAILGVGRSCAPGWRPGAAACRSNQRRRRG